jgi:hypothetical protein
MRIILITLLVIILYSCKQSQNEFLKDQIFEDTIRKKYLVIADSAIRHIYNSKLKLTHNKYLLKDSILTDTLSIDINMNGINEFTFIYVGEKLFLGSGKNLLPESETIYVNVGDELMVRKGGLDYGWLKAFQMSTAFDTLAWDKIWIWPNKNFLFHSSGNMGIGIHDENIRYLAYKRPYQNSWGWISIQLKFNDFRFNEMEVDEFAEKLKLE